MKINDIIMETMSGSFATVSSGIGSGGEETSRSVYPSSKKSKKKEKSLIIRRIPKK